MNSDLSDIHVGDTIAVNWPNHGIRAEVITAESAKQVTVNDTRFWRKDGMRVGDKGGDGWTPRCFAYVIDAEAQKRIDAKRRNDWRAANIKAIRDGAPKLTDDEIRSVLEMIAAHA